MSALPVVTEQTFEQDVLRSDLPVLVEFGAEWCGPCKLVAPELEALSRDLAGKAKILQVDIDKSPRLAQMMRVQSVPTYVVFQGGRPVDAAQGAMKKEQIRAILEPFLPKPAGAISPKELAKLLELGRVIPIDTREPEVFQRAHIKGAQNFPLATLGDKVSELLALPAPGVLYCRAGTESQEKAAQLAQAGAPVAFLDGGVLGWEAEGYRLERP
jgi:thioredoxin 1/putative thioredoxin